MDARSILIHRHKEVQVPVDKEKAMKLFWNLLNSEPYNLGNATGKIASNKPLNLLIYNKNYIYYTFRTFYSSA